MKKKKFMTRLSAVVFAVAIIFAMSVPVFAATDDGAMVIANPTSTNNQIDITKSIVFYNVNGSTVYEPNIIYSYTIAAYDVGSNDITVTDAEGDIGHVKSGVDNAITTKTISISFSSANPSVAALSTGTVVEHTGAFTFDHPERFPSAGIYRYVITENTPEIDKNAKGIVQGSSFNNTRYLDLYVKNGTSGLEVYAAVIFTSTTNGTAGTDNMSNSYADKTTGYNTEAGSGTPTDFSSDTRADHYTTYDFEVKKVVDGLLADKTHEFPFYVQLTNSIAGAKYTYIDDENASSAEDVAVGATITKGSDATNSALKLKHDDSVKFVGVPSNTTSALSIDVKEYNDTVDHYTATATVGNNTTLTVTDGDLIANDATAATVQTYDIKTNDAANQLMTVKNTITEVSPTGLAFRIAPYVLMLAAGVSLIVLFIKRKENEVTDMI